MAAPRQVGVVLDHPLVEQFLEAVGQGKQAGYARDAAFGERLGPVRQFDPALAAVPCEDPALDRQLAAHADRSFAFRLWISSANALTPVGWKVIDSVPFRPSKSARST